MPFDPDKCYIPTVYCGNKERKYPYVEKDNLYEGKGTPHQCLKKGFGGAVARENKKHLPPDSVQMIRYVGPLFEENFRKENILSTKQLIKYVRDNSARNIEQMLRRVFSNSNGSLNGKGYNSTLLYLYHNGQSRLPQCTNLRE
jgi:hypothetical protein